MYKISSHVTHIEAYNLNYNTFRNTILSLFDGSDKCYLPLNTPCIINIMDFDGWHGRTYFIYPFQLFTCDDKENVIEEIYENFLTLLKVYYQSRIAEHPFRIDIFIKTRC